MLGGYDPEKILAAEIAIGKWEDEKKRNEIEREKRIKMTLAKQQEEQYNKYYGNKPKMNEYIKKYCEKLRNLEVNMHNLTDENIIEKVLIERLIDTQQRIMEDYINGSGKVRP